MVDQRFKHPLQDITFDRLFVGSTALGKAEIIGVVLGAPLGPAAVNGLSHSQRRQGPRNGKSSLRFLRAGTRILPACVPGLSDRSPG